MPRKSRAGRRTRADLFFFPDPDALSSGSDEAGDPSPTFSWRFDNTRSSHVVDGPILEAIEKCFIDGTPIDIREELERKVLQVARSEAAEAYATQMIAPTSTNRRRESADLARTLEAFSQEFAEMMPDGNVPTEDPGTGMSHKLELIVINMCQALAIALTAYAATPPTDPPSGGPNTDYGTQAFFSAFERWWRGRAKNPDRRGANAVRDRMAAALWSDTIGRIPEAYTGQEWAKRKFRSICPQIV